MPVVQRAAPGFPMAEQSSPVPRLDSSTSLTGRIVGRFMISERLGKGGMGEVYRAEDTRLKRTVAIKRLSPYLRSDPLYRRRFQEEAERGSRFTDAHVAAIYDVIDEHEETLLVMEYVEGTTLRRRLKEPMSLDEFLRIAVACAEALVAADRVGIVHCDIKPENIMLSTAGSVKILDFGVAKFLPRSDQSSTLDRSGTIGGTPAYMSPEVLLEKGADGRSDIFSLGLVLYEALAGHHPFLSDSYVATTHRILHEKASSIRIFNSTVPEELDRIVARMMAKNPADRYANAQDLVDDLRAVQSGVTPSKLLPRPLIRRQSRKSVWITAVIVLIIVIAGAYGFYAWEHRPPPFHERGWALITDFDSSGDDPIPDKGVREGLTIALQQSPYVNVYPRTRIYEALQRMKRTDVSRIDETLGREICRRENLQVLLTGSIEHLGSAFQITVRGENPATGSLLFAEKEHFNRKEQFFDQADKLARDVRKDLGESVAKIAKTSKPLANVTTNSLDALQLYSEASDYMATGRFDPVPSLLQASLQLDPSFAMAHRMMGMVYGRMGNPSKELEYLQRAYELRGTVTDREQRLIEGSYYEVKGEYEKQVESLKVLAELYPDDLQAHEDLAYAYRNVGDTARAIEQLREVARLSPHSEHAYVELVRFLARANRNDEAIAVYQQASSNNWDNPALHWGLGLALMGEDRTPDAMKEFRLMQDTPGPYRSAGRIYLARAYMYEGKLSAAEEQLKTAVAAEQAARNISYELLARYLLASAYLTQERSALSRSELKHITDAFNPTVDDPGALARAGIMYARMNDSVSAAKVMQRLKVLPIASSSAFARACVNVLGGEILLAQGNSKSALQLLKRANGDYPMMFSHQALAKAYEAQKDWPNAALQWKNVLDSKGEILQDQSPTEWVLAHLEIARVYVRLNDFTSAGRYYREFLQMWDAGDSLPVRAQAVHELQEISN